MDVEFLGNCGGEVLQVHAGFRPVPLGIARSIDVRTERVRCDGQPVSRLLGEIDMRLSRPDRS